MGKKIKKDEKGPPEDVVSKHTQLIATKTKYSLSLFMNISRDKNSLPRVVIIRKFSVTLDAAVFYEEMS